MLRLRTPPRASVPFRLSHGDATVLIAVGFDASTLFYSWDKINFNVKLSLAD